MNWGLRFRGKLCSTSVPGPLGFEFKQDLGEGFGCQELQGYNAKAVILGLGLLFKVKP